MERRKLGFWETGTALQHDQAAGTGILFFLAKIKGNVDRALLREALMLLYQKYPLLRATIQKEEGQFFFILNALFEEIPFEEIERKGEEHWHEIVEKHKTCFPTQRYLWRCVLLDDDKEKAELLFFFHHAIIDGYACVNFLDELLRKYAELEIGAPFEAVQLELLPSIEKLLKEHPNPESIKKTVKELADRPKTAFSYQTLVPIEERTTKHQIVSLESHILKELSILCHKRGLNVNSLLYSALILALQKVEGKIIDILIPTPVNLRKYCSAFSLEEYLESMISYVCDHFEKIEENTDLWSFAETYQKKLTLLIPKAAFLPIEFTLGEIGELNSYLDVRNINKEAFFRFPLTITNEGRFDLPDIYGSLKLEAFYVSSFLQSGTVMINLSVTSVLGRMFLCFSYPHPLISDQYISKISESMLGILKRQVKPF